MKPNLTILLVDDEEDFLNTITRRLERRGHKPLTATTCAAALKSLETATPDAVVLDVKLPDMDGLECLAIIKNKWPRLPVIMLTGHASVNTGIKGLSAGASDYCLKPVTFDFLLERVMIAIEETSICDS